MTNFDFDDELDLPKNSPMAAMTGEDLTAHSVEILKIRLDAVKAEIIRTEQAISDKGDAKNSAESYFT